MKRAAIYIRCSTEKQSEQASPIIQKSDCEAYAAQKGYQVVAVFSDTERYKSGGKWRDPSGSRSDRPQYLGMLKAAYRKEFDVILAWREDRLYRNGRSVVDLTDCMEESGVGVELAKENFDATMAPVKAWAAGLELKAKHDRLLLGIQGRLESGKDFSRQMTYGYNMQDGVYSIDESEATTIRLICDMFAAGASVRLEIRPRLIAEGHKQRVNKNSKYVWSVSRIYDILRKHELYATGKITREYKGQTFHFDCPTLISTETGELIRARLQEHAAFPDWRRNHDDTLANGKVRCPACDLRMHVHTHEHVNRDGTRRRYYKCPSQQTNGTRKAGCAIAIPVKKADALIWEKIYTLLATEGALEKALTAKIATIQAESVNAQEDVDRLTGQLDELVLQRQQVIGWARAKIINEDDLKQQLFALTIQQNEIAKELSEKRLLLGDQGAKFAKIAKHYNEKYSQNLDLIRDIPTDDPEKAAVIFATRRGIVQDLVEMVNVHPDKTVEVVLSIDNGVMTEGLVYQSLSHNTKISIVI